jgi:ATP adenylyltransferase
MEYVEKASAGGEGNFFVDLPAQTNDRENLILYRGRTAFVMLNAYPYTNGHVLIAPYRQTPELTGLNDEELLEINQLLGRAVDWVRACYKPNGFNIGINMGMAAGAGVPTHIHWHVVPRWAGDTNFMTTVGDVRVMPQSLLDSYDRLKEIVSHEH